MGEPKPRGGDNEKYVCVLRIKGSNAYKYFETLHLVFSFAALDETQKPRLSFQDIMVKFPGQEEKNSGTSEKRDIWFVIPEFIRKYLPFEWKRRWSGQRSKITSFTKVVKEDFVGYCTIHNGGLNSEDMRLETSATVRFDNVVSESDIVPVRIGVRAFAVFCRDFGRTKRYSEEQPFITDDEVFQNCKVIIPQAKD